MGFSDEMLPDEVLMNIKLDDIDNKTKQFLIQMKQSKGFVKINKNKLYNENGIEIKNIKKHVELMKPIYSHKKYRFFDLNKLTYIYRCILSNGKIYIGKTKNFHRRIQEHKEKRGSKVTSKIDIKKCEILDECPGILSDDLEEKITDEHIKQFGYNMVRGSKWVNSHNF